VGDFVWRNEKSGDQVDMGLLKSSWFGYLKYPKDLESSPLLYGFH
jgi:hypothetical protein